MSWQHWTFAGLIVLSLLFYVGGIGRPRRPISPNDAVANIVMAVVYLWLLVAGR